METATSPLIILLVGVGAGLAPLLHYFAAEGEKRKNWFFVTLVAVTIGIELVANAVQYGNAMTTRREEERKIADALYAFNQKNEELLTAVTRDPKYHYIEGYWYFKHYGTLHGQLCDTEREQSCEQPQPKWSEKKKESCEFLKKAKIKLKTAAREHHFEAQSYYLLGHIIRTTEKQSSSPNLSPAREYYDEAINVDSHYAAAYYGKALLEEHNHELRSALNDLKEATWDSLISCYDVWVDDRCIWKSIENSQLTSEFEEMKSECRTHHELGSIIPSAPENKCADAVQSTPCAK